MQGRMWLPFGRNGSSAALNPGGFLPYLPSALLSLVKTFRLLASVLCLLVAAARAQALLGETLAEISKHRGKPTGKPEADKAVWTFEGDDGLLVYGVKFDERGRSIAETLKPGQLGRRLQEEFVMDFIKAQKSVLGESQTLRLVQPGQKYVFAGQPLSVAENEYVLVDDPRGFLLVWIRGSLPSVTVLTPAAMK